MTAGIMEIDIHGMNTYQAKICLTAALKRSRGAYRIRVIHGYHGGTALRETVRREIAADPRVIRWEAGMNPGETDLVLREY